MLNELLHCLLGFAGDIFEEKTDSFCVKDGFPYITDQEKCVLDKIISLGWFYNRLTSFVKSCSHGNASEFQSYLCAFGSGVNDLLHEYIVDVASLECEDTPENKVLLTTVEHRVQKVPHFHLRHCCLNHMLPQYLIIFPVLHKLCLEVTNQVRGGRILDLLMNFSTGIPSVKKIIAR